MRGAVLYGPHDVRFEERADAEDYPTNRRHYQNFGDLRLRLRSVALSRAQPSPSPRPWGMSTAASSRTWAAQ